LSADFITAPFFGAQHGFFTRRGGVSTGPYASLNCSLSGGDDPGAVTENRRLVAEAMGAAPAKLLGLKQVHGNLVVTVNEPWPAGVGPEADGFVTSRPDLALGIITADCAPVLFADLDAGVVGAAHAGWRGAVAGVLEATIDAMIVVGAAGERIHAVVGPCIAQESYEVGDDLRDAVIAATPDAGALFDAGKRPGRWQFDLTGYCLQRLDDAGILNRQCVRRDTLADGENFFSHRRRTLAGGGPIGHQISVVRL
jgi:YfiH family protein